MEKTAFKIQQVARQQSPVRTGYLRNNIDVRLAGDRKRTEVIANTDYAWRVEERSSRPGYFKAGIEEGRRSASKYLEEGLRREGFFR